MNTPAVLGTGDAKKRFVFQEPQVFKSSCKHKKKMKKGATKEQCTILRWHRPEDIRDSRETGKYRGLSISNSGNIEVLEFKRRG